MNLDLSVMKEFSEEEQIKITELMAKSSVCKEKRHRTGIVGGTVQCGTGVGYLPDEEKQNVQQLIWICSVQILRI